MRSSVGVLAALLVGCGGHSAVPDAGVLHDASPDVVPQGPNLVTLDAGDGLSLIVYRDGTGPWQVPQETSPGQYALHVTNDYEWLLVCTSGASFDAELQAATYADGASQFGFCFADGGAAPSTVPVTGQMAQAGIISMYDRATSSTPSWSFTLNVPPGTHDLVAVGVDNRMLIRRNLQITAATTESLIDVDANGTAMTSVPLTVNGLGSDTLSTELDLLLSNDLTLIDGTSTMLEAPPASLLLPTDSEFLSLAASTSSTTRTAFTSFTGAETTFTLMPALSGVTFDASSGALKASWATLPSYTNLDMYLAASAAGAFSTERVSVSKSWLMATGATSIAFDQMPPGYDASWKIDLSGPYVRGFEARDESGSILYGTSYLEAVNGASARQVQAKQRARLLRASVARRRVAAQRR